MKNKWKRMENKRIKNKRRNNSFFLCAIILFTFFMVVGGSYAFLSLTLFSEKTVEVTTGVLATSFKDGNAVTLENAYPMTDSRGMMTSPYEFEVENTGDIKAKYDIILEENRGRTQLDKKYIKYSIKSSEGGWSEPVLLSTLNNLVLEKGIEIEPGEKKAYALRLWLDEKADNETQGKEYQARIVINIVQSDGSTTDITPPMIHLAGDLSIDVEENATFHDPGVESVTDDKDTLDKNDVKVSYEYYDGETTKTVDGVDTSKRGVYYIYYKISDQSGNEGARIRSVNVYKKDTEPPVIRLKGESEITIERDSVYEEQGAEAEKNGEDFSSRIVTVGEVNPKKQGIYFIKYIVTDKEGNTASIVRTVTVVKITWYQVVYDYKTNGGSSVSKEEAKVRKGEKADFTVQAEKEGFIFVGWNTNKDATTGLEDFVVEDDTTLYAIYKKEAITYRVQFEGNGNTIDTTSKNCTIGEVYNNGTQEDSCTITTPTITAPSATPTVIGYSSSASSHEKVIGSGESLRLTSSNQGSTYYAQTRKDAISRTVYFNANGNTISATSVSCSIGATYNGVSQGSSCSATAPTISAPSATPSIIGYSNSSSSRIAVIGNSASFSITSSNHGATYYAQTMRGAVTRSVTYSRGSGVSAIGKTSDSCSIAATYNGTGQASSCAVSLPSISSASGYNTGFWSTSSSASSGYAAGTSISLSSNATYYARALDTTKPVWSFVSSNPSSGTIGSSNTITITFKGTDTSGSVTPTIAAGNITVKAGSTTVSPTTKTLSAATSVTNGKQYTLTLAGIKEDGVVSITIAASTLKDGSGNTNNAATLTTGVTVKSVTVSKGNVKGGSITLGVTKASVGETVSFTTSPTSGFTYQGATVVCEDTNKIIIASTAKSFTTTSNCKTPIVWPSWKKNDYTVWWSGQTNNTGGVGAFKYDGITMMMSWNKDNTTALSFEGNNTGMARGQATTANTYDVTDYAQLKSGVWCLRGAGFNMYIGLVKSRTTWVNGGTFSSAKHSWSGTNNYQNITANISSATGSYYISSQMLVSIPSGGFYCTNDTMQLLGKTYGYGDTGL